MIKRIFKNTLFLSISQIISRLIGFGYFILLARVLGVEKFGVYSFTVSFVYGFIPIADFGIERLILINLSRDPQNSGHYLSRLLPLRLVLGIFAYVLLLISGLFLRLGFDQIIYLMIFGLSIIPYNISFLLTGYLNSREEMIFSSVVNICLVLFTAIFVLTFFLFNLNFYWILSAYPLSNILLTIFILRRSFRWRIPLGWNIDVNFWKKILRSSWIFALLTIIAVFYLRLSVVMVNLLLGSVSTGIYSSAFKFIEAGILIPQSLALALFPVSSKLFAEDKNKLKKVYLHGLVTLFALSLLAVAVIRIFSKDIIGLSYGQKYLTASPVFSLLSISLIFFFMNALAANIILNSKKTKTYIILNLGNLLVLFLSCMVLIPKYYLMGAGLAVLIAEICGFIINNLLIYFVLKEESK